MPILGNMCEVGCTMVVAKCVYTVLRIIREGMYGAFI